MTAAVWVGAWAFFTATFTPLNDHFGRISSGWQPLVILAVWMIACLWPPAHVSVRRAPVRRLALVVAAALTIWSVSVAADWGSVRARIADPARVVKQLRSARRSPPEVPDGLGPGVASVVRYVHACTEETDRVFTTWFVPELYFLAGRGFAGRIVAAFSGHWSEPRFQTRSIEAFAAHRVPLIVVDLASYDTFRQNYPMLDEYLSANYGAAGDTDFESAMPSRAPYRLLVRRDLAFPGRDAQTSLPCLAQ